MKYVLILFFLANSPLFGQELHWQKTWTIGEPRGGVPESLTGGSSSHNSTECGELEIPPLGLGIVIEKDGERFHRAGIDTRIDENPCTNGQNPTFRNYPSFGFHTSERFDFPVLVRVKMRYLRDQEDFAPFRDRFSQLTIKGKDGAAGEILTLHVLESGEIDIGHALQTWPPGRKSSTVKIPINKWFIQSLYIYSKTGQTLAVAWIDTMKAVEAAGLVHWADKQLRHTHTGVYYQDVKNYPIPETI